MQTNCYILAKVAGGEAVIIDPGAESRKIKAVLAKYKLKPAVVANTHGHYDHIGCDDEFQVPVLIHQDDTLFLNDPMLNLSGLFALPYKVGAKVITLEDGQIIEYAGITLKVLHIPGHTPGGVAFLLQAPQNNIVFTGDTLFCQGIGRSDLAGGDEALLIRKIKEKLLSLPDRTVVYPGHGPSTTIGEEKNPGDVSL
jgi:glyoxylase-like metal-dependent hydrolase (beta-lactamase superfamily II)